MKGRQIENVEVNVSVESFAKDLTKFSLRLMPTILKAPTNKYYFCEIYDEKLLDISAKLDGLLKEEMNPPRFPLTKDNLHHVTLGYKYPDCQTIAPVIGKTVQSFTVDKLQISIMGKFGVCIGVLKTFYLK